MLKFIESTDELRNYFAESDVESKQYLWIPVLSDVHLHWVNNRVSFIYIYCVGTSQEAIVSFHHNDCQNLPISVLNDFLGNGNYIYHKKYLTDSDVDFEAEMIYWLNVGEKIEKGLESIPTIERFRSMYRELSNVNDVIPIMKWLEHCRNIRDKFIFSCKNIQMTEPLKLYNSMATELGKIEKNGLYTN